MISRKARLAPAFTAFAALLLIAAPAVPLAAQPAPAVVAADPYLHFVQVMNNSVDQEVLLQRAIAQVGDVLRTANPDVIEMERLFPGTVDRMLTAMTPMMRQHSQNVRDRFEITYADLLRGHLTVAEANDAASFYASPIGQRLMTSLQNNMSFDSQIADVASGGWEGDISTSAISSDLRETQQAALGEISAADMEAMNRRAQRSSWMPKILALRPQILALRAEMENAPMDPALEARMNAAVEAVVVDLIGPEPAKPQPVRRK